MKKTKIICTLGKNIATKEMISNLTNVGMNIVRINLSHSTKEDICNYIKIIREVEEEEKFAIGIALDTSGPELRIKVKEGNINFKKGDLVKFTNCEENDGVYVNLTNFESLRENTMVLVNDGASKFTITKIENDYFEAEAMNGCSLENGKGMNIPGVPLNLPILSEKDKECIKVGIENEVDFIFASFVSSADDYKEIKKFIDENNGNQEIISKIESKAAMDNLEEILELSDGLMIARGDLCVEIGHAELFAAQKKIASYCTAKDKICICATQMMESMIVNDFPTRAEISDVGNAVLDGVDCVMLSGETAVGSFPIETVKIMSEICEKAEIFALINDVISADEAYLLQDAEIDVVDKVRNLLRKSAIFITNDNIKTLRKISIRKNCLGFFKEVFDKKTTEEFWKISIKKIVMSEDYGKIEEIDHSGIIEKSVFIKDVLNTLKPNDEENPMEVHEVEVKKE